MDEDDDHLEGDGTDVQSGSRRGSAASFTCRQRCWRWLACLRCCACCGCCNEGTVAPTGKGELQGLLDSDDGSADEMEDDDAVTHRLSMLQEARQPPPSWQTARYPASPGGLAASGLVHPKISAASGKIVIRANESNSLDEERPKALPLLPPRHSNGSKDSTAEESPSEDEEPSLDEPLPKRISVENDESKGFLSPAKPPGVPKLALKLLSSRSRSRGVATVACHVSTGSIQPPHPCCTGCTCRAFPEPRWRTRGRHVGRRRRR